ncbi:MAG: tetratricopeptide repeat protein [Bacteroidota bacterium]
MKIFKTTILLIITILMFAACGNKMEKAAKNIKQMEDALLKDSTGIDIKKAKDLTDAYLAYADEFPKDTLAPVFIFKAADISMNISKPEQAVNLFNRVLKDYPDFRRAPDCIFMKAFLYENVMKNLKKAEEFYKEFIKKYPNHELAKDAQISINNLGKTPEQLIAEFEAKNDSAQTAKK